MEKFHISDDTSIPYDSPYLCDTSMLTDETSGERFI